MAARALEVSFDYLSPSTIIGSGYGASPNATAHVLAVLWNQLLVYPAGRAADDLTCTARLRLPKGWKYATALTVASDEGGDLQFSPVPLTTLVDSPLIAGEYFRSSPVAPGES